MMGGEGVETAAYKLPKIRALAILQILFYKFYFTNFIFIFYFTDFMLQIKNIYFIDFILQIITGILSCTAVYMKLLSF